MVIVYLVKKDYVDLTPEGPHKISIVLAFHQEHNHGYMILITIEHETLCIHLQTHLVASLVRIEWRVRPHLTCLLLGKPSHFEGHRWSSQLGFSILKHLKTFLSLPPQSGYCRHGKVEVSIDIFHKMLLDVLQNNSTSHPTAEYVHSTTSFGQEHDGEGDPVE